MLKTEKNKNLKSLNTFGIDIYANYYINIENTDDIIRSIEAEQYKQDLPDFGPGDTVKVHVKVVEGTNH